MPTKLSLLIVFLLLSSSLLADYVYNERCRQALSEIYMLKTRTARKTLAEEKKLNPDNDYALYLEHYCDAMELLLTEDASRYEQFCDDFDARREIMDQGDVSSPYHLLLESEMYFILGLAHLKFGGKLNGASKVFSAYKRVKENQELFPDFWMNDKMAGLFNMIFANIPPSVRWVTRILGIRGDMQAGFDQLLEYYERAKDVPGYNAESIILVNMGYKMTWNERGGFEFLSGLAPEVYNITLVKYFYANMASWAAENDLAITLLDGLDRDSQEVDFWAPDYLKGRCKLNRLDEDADIYLLRYLDNFAGEDYKKDVCNRLSWHYLVHGNEVLFLEYKHAVADIGDDLRDRDREAVIESKLPYKPHVYLLKSRLLFDGGYYLQADSLLNLFLLSSTYTKAFELEYHYRRGRVLQKLGHTDEAVTHLKITIDRGKEEPYTFATRAALQLGLICEGRQDYEKAEEYFELCFDLYDSDHTVDGVENKAEMGLKRVEAVIE